MVAHSPSILFPLSKLTCLSRHKLGASLPRLEFCLTHRTSVTPESIRLFSPKESQGRPVDASPRFPSGFEKVIARSLGMNRAEEIFGSLYSKKRPSWAGIGEGHAWSRNAPAAGAAWSVGATGQRVQVIVRLVASR